MKKYNSKENKAKMSVSAQYNPTTISPGGIRGNLWKYIEKVTGERSLKKFISQGLIFNFFGGLPTIISSVLRGKVYRKLLGGVGSNCIIEKDVRFLWPQRIFLGNRVFIGEGSYLVNGSHESGIYIKDDVTIRRQAILKVNTGKIVINERVTIADRVIIRGSGGVEIGRDSLIAEHVELIAATHIFENPFKPIRLQGGETKKVVIGEDVWLGAHVIVLPGVTIGNGSVVGAGSVVTRDIPSYSIAIGVPAKVIRKRNVHEGLKSS